MKIGILLGILFTVFCEVRIKLFKTEISSLYYTSIFIGSSNTSLIAIIDLSGQYLVLPCYYSHSEEKNTYLPSISSSSECKDKTDNCKIKKFDKSKSNDLCGMTLEILPGQKVTVNEFYDSSVLGGVKLLKNNFFCIENIEEYNLKIKDAVLGLGPKSQILSQIFESQKMPKVFNISFEPGKEELFLGVNWKTPDISKVIELKKETDNYSFNIDSISYLLEGNTSVIITESDFSLGTNSKYSFLTTQNYFSLTRELKSLIQSQITLTKFNSRECFNLTNPNDLKNFPDLVINFKNTTKLNWKSSEYLEKISDIYCLGIFPSFTNILGMNFLQGKKILIDLKEFSLEFIEEISQEKRISREPSESNTTLIISICIFVILLQIAAGYYFLTKNSSPPQLQRPNIPVNQLDISY